MSLSDKCLSIILLGIISLSCPRKVCRLTIIDGPVGEKQNGVWRGVRRTKILKCGWVFITNIEHIFAERSLHKQMAALCCSAHVPCHNSEWFSSSISFILESHPLIWLRETYPPLALTSYQSHQRYTITMQAAQALITSPTDKMKNKTAARSFLSPTRNGTNRCTGTTQTS